MKRERVVYALRVKPGQPTLVEIPAKEAEAFLAAEENREVYARKDAVFAHRWVRDFRHHETALYLDGNFVRRAKCAE